MRYFQLNRNIPKAFTPHAGLRIFFRCVFTVHNLQKNYLQASVEACALPGGASQVLSSVAHLFNSFMIGNLDKQ